MHAELGTKLVLRRHGLHCCCATLGREPSDICALLQRLQYGRSSAGTVLSALQAIQTCTASPDSAQARMSISCLFLSCCLGTELYHPRSILPQCLEVTRLSSHTASMQVLGSTSAASLVKNAMLLNTHR